MTDNVDLAKWKQGLCMADTSLAHVIAMSWIWRDREVEDRKERVSAGENAVHHGTKIL